MTNHVYYTGYKKRPLNGHLRHQALVLAEPGFSHGCLAVKAACQLLQLLLTNQFIPQGQLTLMLRLLQTLPGLNAHTNTL